MRGKAVACRVSSSGHGITPAYAGKSLAFSAFSARELGSPPHMRGKAASSVRLAAPQRITPAYAGKRAFGSMGAEIPWDHPRICGEKVGVCYRRQRLLGSPPHMRGKVRLL